MLGVGQVLLKDESSRLGLPAFKILGASWAIYRALELRIGTTLEPWQTLADLAKRLAPLRPLTLSAATDGNHGRAVAHMARLLGFESRIYVPAGTAQARIDAIASEGARVEVVDGTYDEAVARSALDASERCLVISDTSWPGYEEVPCWVIDGYSTIFWEVDDELARLGQEDPQLVIVQVGVGALAAAIPSPAGKRIRASASDSETLNIAPSGIVSNRRPRMIAITPPPPGPPPWSARFQGVRTNRPGAGP